jgi:hypothetical protein
LAASSKLQPPTAFSTLPDCANAVETPRDKTAADAAYDKIRLMIVPPVKAREESRSGKFIESGAEGFLPIRDILRKSYASKR